MSGKDAKIVIVGAGAAGLSAAHHLYKNGFENVVILEAMDRIGGRIHTVQFGESPGIIEMGANWIHGVGEENSMFTLAKSKGVITEPYIFLNRLEGKWCTEDGTRIPKELVERAWEMFCNIENQMGKTCNTGSVKSSKEYFNDKLDTALLDFKPPDRPMVKAAFNCMMNYFCFHNGNELQNISSELLGRFHEIPGGNVKIANGFLKILRLLREELPRKTIQFEKTVTKIQLESKLRQIRVICGSGVVADEYMADHIILTCSLGYLRAHYRDLFYPPLPVDKVDAINSLGFGKVNKIFLHFEKPFWNKGEGGVKFAWKNVTDVVDVNQWYKSIFAFDEVLNNPNVLIGWIHGRAAEYMETLPESIVSQTCTELLRTFLKNVSIPEPNKMITSKWCSNPFSLGSYSYFDVQSSSKDTKTLARPLFLDSKPVICFAGEATSEHRFSTTDGARSSGLREAKRIIDYYTQTSKLKNGKWLTEPGTYVSTDVVDTAWDLLEDIEEKLDHRVVKDKTKSVQDYIDTRLAKKIEKIDIDERPNFRAVFNGLTNDIGVYEGDDLSNVSAKLHEIGEDISEDHVGLPQGFSFLLHSLADELPEEWFKFEKFVSRICWQDELARININGDDGSEEYFADHVIVTCSLGHLKQNHFNLFNPPLPQFKIDAITRMGFGKVGKIFLYYETPFWKKGEGRFYLARDDTDDSWSKSIISFTEVVYSPNVLLAFVYGEGVTEMETLPEEQVIERCGTLLQTFLQRDIPYASKALKSSWCTDRLFLGSYCYFAVSSRANDVEDIASPLMVEDKPVVCFAGEATHPKWLSYAHGARSSGIREAKRIEMFYSE